MLTTLPTGSTRVVAVIGDPIAHSLSPVIHNAAFEACGLDWVMVACRVIEGEGRAAIEGARALGFAGLSVTMPHKETAAMEADFVSERVELLGAANVLAIDEDGTIFGDSTDGPGLLEALAHGAGFEPSSKRCVVIGAGGAARAVVLALAEAGADEVVVVNRSGDRAKVAAALAGKRGRVGSAEDATSCDLVVQATPVGMAGIGASLGRDSYPVDPSRFHAGQTVVDLVYHPVRTLFLDEAAAAGAETVDGVGMLVHQAARAFAYWTEQEAPVAVMETAARKAIGYDG